MSSSPFRTATALVVTIVFALTSMPSLAAVDPPDVVQLKNGGIVRGTILEAVPGETVRIQLSDGKLREFAPETIEYAGPDRGITAVPPPPGVPSPVPPSVPVTTSEVTSGASVVLDRVRVDVVSPNLGATLGINAGTSSWAGGGAAFTGRGMAPVSMAGLSAHYRTLCTAPCAVELQRGAHQFNLTLPDGRSAVAPRVMIPSPGVLQANYVSRNGLRAAGWVVLITGAVFGSAMTLDTEEKCSPYSSSSCEEERPLLVPGLILLVSSLLAGLPMTMASDRVKTSFVPGMGTAQ